MLLLPLKQVDLPFSYRKSIKHCLIDLQYRLNIKLVNDQWSIE